MDSQTFAPKNAFPARAASRSGEGSSVRPRQFGLQVLFVWMGLAAVQFAALRINLVLALHVPLAAAAAAALYFRRRQPQQARWLWSVCGVFVGIELLVAFFAMNVTHVCGGCTKDRKAKIELSCIKLQLETFQMDVGRYPTQAEGLRALESRPRSVSGDKWCGPYPDGGTLPQDPWGKPYTYQFQSTGIVLTSHGLDGRPATKDDVQLRFTPHLPLQRPR